MTIEELVAQAETLAGFQNAVIGPKEGRNGPAGRNGKGIAFYFYHPPLDELRIVIRIDMHKISQIKDKDYFLKKLTPIRMNP